MDGRILDSPLANDLAVLLEQNGDAIDTSGFITQVDQSSETNSVDVELANDTPKISSIGVASSIGESGLVVIQFDGSVTLEEGAISLFVKQSGSTNFTPVESPVNLIEPDTSVEGIQNFVASLPTASGDSQQTVRVVIDGNRIQGLSGEKLSLDEPSPMVSDFDLAIKTPALSNIDAPIFTIPAEQPPVSDTSSTNGDQDLASSGSGSDEAESLTPDNSSAVQDQADTDEVADVKPTVELSTDATDEPVNLDQVIQIKLSVPGDVALVDDGDFATNVCNTMMLTNLDTQQDVTALPLSITNSEIICDFTGLLSNEDFSYEPGNRFEISIPENVIVDSNNLGNDEFRSQYETAAEKLITLEGGFISVAIDGEDDQSASVQLELAGQSYRQNLSNDDLASMCRNYSKSDCLKVLSASLVESYITTKIENESFNQDVSLETVISRVVNGDIVMNADGTVVFNSIKDDLLANNSDVEDETSSPLANESDDSDGTAAVAEQGTVSEQDAENNNTEGQSENSNNSADVAVNSDSQIVADDTVAVSETDKSANKNKKGLRRLQRLLAKAENFAEIKTQRETNLNQIRLQLEGNDDPKKSLIKQERKAERKLTSIDKRIAKNQEKIDRIQQRLAKPEKVEVLTPEARQAKRAERRTKRQEQKAQRQLAKQQKDLDRQARKQAREQRKAARQEAKRLKQAANKEANLRKQQEKSARIKSTRAERKAERDAKRKAKAQERAARKAERQARRAAAKAEQAITQGAG